MKIISTEEYNQLVDCMNNVNKALKELKLKNEKLETELNAVKNNLAPDVSGSLLLHDLFAVAAIENEDGMPVIKYVDKPNGGSVAYVRHDAMVNKLNGLLKQ